MTADQPQTQTPPHQVEPEPLLPVVSLAEAAHLDPHRRRPCWALAAGIVAAC
jgi:hypothetical protein